MGKEDELIFKTKLFFKKYPRIFLFLYYTLGIFVGKSAKKSIAHLPKGSLILNLGSGPKVIREDVVNIDCHPYPGVKVVADVYKLPFDGNSVDAVIAESLLEHLKEPERAVREILRVLKPGGMLYILVPFMLGFHSSPDDYHRWTTSGLRELLKDFEEKELGIAMGPTNALTYFLKEWLAIIFSFGSSFFYQIWSMCFMIVLAPVNLLDFILVHFKPAKIIAYAYYYIGIKPHQKKNL
jgi:SAM-dependent methyltransferase